MMDRKPINDSALYDEYDSFDPTQPPRLPRTYHDQLEQLRDMDLDLEQEDERMKAGNLERRIQRKDPTARRTLNSSVSHEKFQSNREDTYTNKIEKENKRNQEIRTQWKQQHNL